MGRKLITLGRVLVPIVAVAWRSKRFRLYETPAKEQIEHSVGDDTWEDNGFAWEGLARPDDGFIGSGSRVRKLE